MGIWTRPCKMTYVALAKLKHSGAIRLNYRLAPHEQHIHGVRRTLAAKKQSLPDVRIPAHGGGIRGWISDHDKCAAC
jgi:hypothetical protein